MTRKELQEYLDRFPENMKVYVSNQLRDYHMEENHITSEIDGFGEYGIYISCFF